MPALCTSCGQSSARYTLKFFGGGTQTVCHKCEHPTERPAAVVANLFAGDGLVMQHATDELGKPLRATSMRELRELEKRYHFSSTIAETDEANFNCPPPPRITDPFEQMTKDGKWLYPDVAERMLKEMRQNGELIEPKRDKLIQRDPLAEARRMQELTGRR